MALYIIHKRNPYFKLNTIIELFEDGFQKAKVTESGHVVGHEGLILPEQDVLPFCIKMLNKGFDDPKLRQKSGRGQLTQDENAYQELAEELLWEDAKAGLHSKGNRRH